MSGTSGLSACKGARNPIRRMKITTAVAKPAVAGTMKAFSAFSKRTKKILEQRTTRMRCFLGNSNPEFQRQIARSFPGSNLRQQLLSLLQRRVLAPAQSTELQMPADGMHLRPGHRAVQIRREQRFCLCTRHGIASLVLPRIETR